MRREIVLIVAIFPCKEYSKARDDSTIKHLQIILNLHEYL